MWVVAVGAPPMRVAPYRRMSSRKERVSLPDRDGRTVNPGPLSCMRGNGKDRWIDGDHRDRGFDSRKPHQIFIPRVGRSDPAFIFPGGSVDKLRCNKCRYEYFRIKYERDGAISVICENNGCGHKAEIQITSVDRNNAKRSNAKRSGSVLP